MEIQKDFKTLLQKEYQKRMQKNRLYSLRAYARFLGIDSSFLSKIFASKRPVTSKTIDKLSGPLNLTRTQIEYYKGLAGYGVGDGAFKALSETEFDVISDWFHYAILEMTHLDYFVSDPAWIAQRLKVSVQDVAEAIQKLLRMGLLSLDENARLRVNENCTTTTNPFTSAAFKKIQKQINQQAIEALDDIPFEKRSHSTITLCGDSERLEEAKKKIAAFRRELMVFLESGEKKDRVFQMSISLFPIVEEN
nr:DUF4423 domain-containing protein [uncultured Bdellovibrio sp.]